MKTVASFLPNFTTSEQSPPVATSKTNILLTGVTGIVGRHVLYELLKKYESGELTGKIAVLARARPAQNLSGKQRVWNLLTHAYAPDYLKQYNTEDLMRHIIVVEGDLADADIGEKLNLFPSEETGYVIHSAATTNLGTSEKAFKENYKINYEGTLNLLENTASFANKFTFISTAYSCGVQEGTIPNSYLNDTTNDHFRNHYEAIKNQTERDLTIKCTEMGIDWQILRPAIICGRLMDAPLYFTPTFNVFYEYGKFFHRINNSQETLRIACQPNSGLHIIPVDYVAKVIVGLFQKDIQELNIAPSKRFKMSDFVSTICNELGYKKFELVEEAINDKNNTSELLYYKTVGRIFHQYLNTPVFEFDTSPIKKLIPQLEEPVAAQNFSHLLGFATQHDFQAL